MLNYDFDARFLKDNIIDKNAKNNGIQYIFKFDNGYGASLVKNPLSYGGEEDLWEIAVLSFDNNGYKIVYDTSITDDVVGYLDEVEAFEVLCKIGNL